MNINNVKRKYGDNVKYLEIENINNFCNRFKYKIIVPSQMTELYTGISDGPGAKGYKISEVGGSSSLGRFCFSAEFAMIHENRVGPIYDHRLYYKTCHDTKLLT